MFHCSSDAMSKLLMIMNSAPANCWNFEVKQMFSLDFGQEPETSTSFFHGIASIGFMRGCLKCEFPTGLGFAGSVFDVIFRVFGLIYVKKVHFIRHTEIVKVFFN